MRTAISPGLIMSSCHKIVTGNFRTGNTSPHVFQPASRGALLSVEVGTAVVSNSHDMPWDGAVVADVVAVGG